MVRQKSAPASNEIYQSQLTKPHHRYRPPGKLKRSCVNLSGIVHEIYPESSEIDDSQGVGDSLVTSRKAPMFTKKLKRI